jgi:lysozyme
MKQFRIKPSEKERILNLHENATNNQYLNILTESEMVASSNFWKMIKNFEGDPRNQINGIKEPMYTAYQDTANIWTIGYGHIDGVKKGLKIDKKTANDFLYQDTVEAVKCVRRILSQWKENGLKVRLTQGQFDSLVSLVFNVGCDGVRMSDFIQDIKKGKMKSAGEKIKSFKTSGGIERRNIEAQPFMI